MPFFWNDDTYWSRIKFGNKIFLKISLPSIFIIFIILFIATAKVLSLKEIILLSLPIYGVLYTFIDIFLQLPHYRIPDTYSKKAKMALYVLNFSIALFALYLLGVGILQHHYIFFESLVCCDLVKNFKL